MPLTESKKKEIICECGQMVKISYLKKHQTKKHHFLLLKKINNEITEDETRILNIIIDATKVINPGLKIKGFFE
jgi:hypothetical protein